MNLADLPICEGCGLVKVYCDCRTQRGVVRRASKHWNAVLGKLGLEPAGHSEVMPRQHNNRTMLRNES